MTPVQQIVSVLVDDRERSSGVPATLEAMDDVRVETKRLPLGDYQIDRRLLFERKTLNDFAVSVLDGRLFKQMTNLAMSPQKSVLILEAGSSLCGQIATRLHR